MGLVLGLALASILGIGLPFGAKLFTKDVNVLHLIKIGIPVKLFYVQIGNHIGILSSQPPKLWDLHSNWLFLSVCRSHSTPQHFGICV